MHARIQKRISRGGGSDGYSDLILPGGGGSAHEVVYMHWVYRITEIRGNSLKLTTTFVRFCEILGGFQWFQRISVIPDTPLDTPFPSPLFRFSLRKCLTICCYISYIVFKDAFTSRFINTCIWVSPHPYTLFTNHLLYKLSK